MIERADGVVGPATPLLGRPRRGERPAEIVAAAAEAVDVQLVDGRSRSELAPLDAPAVRECLFDRLDELREHLAQQLGPAEQPRRHPPSTSGCSGKVRYGSSPCSPPSRPKPDSL